METIENNRDVGSEESDVEDFTVGDRNGGQVRLQKPIDVSRLLQNESVTLEPLVEAGRDLEGVRNYFVGGEGDIERSMASFYLDGDDGEEVAATFEEKLARMTDVTGDGGVRKKIVKPGFESGGDMPQDATVTVKYSMQIEGQDEPFDSTYLRGHPERHRLGQGRLFPGFEAAVQSMLMQETAEFIIEPAYAFGSMGCPPRIPGDSRIYARIELVEFFQADKAESLLSMAPEERSKSYQYDDIEKIVSGEHVSGNRYFNNGEYKLAVAKYKNGIKLLEEVDVANDDVEKRLNHLILKLYMNAGLCYLKLKYPKKACIVLDSAIKIDGRCSKALYRMGKAKRMLCNYADARKFFTRALHVKPNEATIGEELRSLDVQIAKEKRDAAVMCKRMFNFSSKPEQRSGEPEYSLDDDDFADIVEHLNEFKLADDQQELVLPLGFNERAIQQLFSLASQLDLNLEKRQRQYVITKK